MTVSKGGLSTSVGVKGARVTRTAAGRTTRSVGIPGSGVYHTKTISSISTRSSAPAPSAAEPPKPGFTSPKWEKELHKALTRNNLDDLPRIGSTYPEVAFVAGAMDGLNAVSEGRDDRALTVLQWVWDHGDRVEEHPFATKYLHASTVTVGVAQGVEAAVPFGRDAVGLALVELLQDKGNIKGAIEVAERLDPSRISAVSLAELYVESLRYDDVVDLTSGIQNEDDATALLMTFRGLALRELGHHTAARGALKEALKSKARDAGIRHLALLERSRSYQAENKNAQARKDLERILAEDSSFPGIRDALAALDQT
jgi:tetratricopeptide (TPR) repeat protein